MPSVAKKAAAKKPAAKTAPAAKPVAAASSSRAAQAAAHQGRPEPQPETRRPAAQVPATRPQAAPPAVAESVKNLPSFMQQYADAGKEAIGKDDIEIPRLKLMQGLSPELTEYDDLKAGYFFHPAAEFIFDQPFKAVPIFMDQRYILWRPRDAGGGILARADDGQHWSPANSEFTVVLDKKDGGATVKWRTAKTVSESGLANWGTMNPADPDSPPAATLMYNFLLAFPDEPDLMPAVLSFQRSSIKSGRRFNTKLKTVRAPIFGTVWEFSSVKETNGRGQDFFNLMVKAAGLVEDEGTFDQYRQMHEQFTSKGLTIKDIEGLQGEDAAAAEGEQGEAEGAPRY